MRTRVGSSLVYLLAAAGSVAAETFCDNAEYGRSLCDGTFRGSRIRFEPRPCCPRAGVQTCCLSGTIPNGVIGDLLALEKFDLNGFNRVSGTLPRGRYALEVTGRLTASGRSYDLQLADARGLTASLVRKIQAMSEDEAAAYR